ncbi:C40 family peptidase [Roseburia zhanii]|uniref:C40 family peptidase n=1 Tax=Roseburia zhanii TaxID=2763064 RepID=UPI002ED31299
MRKQGGKRFLAVMLVVAAAMTQVLSVNASTMSKAKDAKKAAESDLNKANSQIETIEKQQQALQNEIDAKDAELVNLLVNIGILEDELDSKNAQLEQVTADLAKAEQTEADQYASMKKRIQFMYERGDTAMIESLLGSENMADFLNRVEYVSEVYDYDRNLLTQYQTTVQQVADLKSTVETEKAELEAMEDEYAAQQTELENVLAAKKARMGDYNNQLATAQAEAEAYKKTIAAQNKIIKEEERKQKEQEEKARAAAAKASAGNSNSSTSGTGNTGNSTGGTSSNSTGSSGGGENPSYSTSVSGSSVVSYACQFVGNPYVWGGTSLTNGADCSGFVMSVFAHFGVSLPHSSGALQGCGKAVSYANAQPGDLICYSGHVAIYMGGGQIVHAQSTAVGITTSSATYRTIVAVRRVL